MDMELQSEGGGGLRVRGTLMAWTISRDQCQVVSSGAATSAERNW